MQPFNVPIILFGYNRPEFMRACLDALSIQSIRPYKIIAYIDYPKTNTDIDLVDETINTIERYAKELPIVIVKRDQNLGCTHNILNGLDEVCQEYEHFIQLEDDIIPTCYFYENICLMLDKFKDDKSVFSVSCSNFLYDNKLYSAFEKDYLKFSNYLSNRNIQLFKTRNFSSQGWASWKDKWQELRIYLKEKPLAVRNNLNSNIGELYLSILKKLKLNSITNDTNYDMHVQQATMQKGYYHIYSSKSCVTNIGYGHPSASHCYYPKDFKIDFEYSPNFKINNFETIIESPFFNRTLSIMDKAYYEWAYSYLVLKKRTKHALVELIKALKV